MGLGFNVSFNEFSGVLFKKRLVLALKGYYKET